MALELVGALLPLVPTTILALRAWREDGAIGSQAKGMASADIALGYALFWWSAQPGLAADLIVGLIMAGCAAFILSRPTRRAQ
ncbi:hypothetical protein [Sphingomonas koreensis]